MLGLWTSLVAVAVAAPPRAPSWEDTIDRVSPAVVSIEVTATRSFDTESAGTSYGTGFVVDAERGLLLTNRHMVHAGPVKARAIFLDNEEVELEPIYRDPVHDFGFYHFDPSKVRFMDLVQLQLAPDAAKVGMEIRVVGNDAGEKLSILDGTLARLDRNAPRYGANTYNDFNTFYYQAASNTSGGSSGSPVLAIDGSVVALNAGGRNEAASSFYLPLPRVARALALLQQGSPVPRGTLQTTFYHQSFGDLGRLQLQPATEARVRREAPSASGMLMVSIVSPGGPADQALRPGDVLVTIDGRLVTDFLAVDAALDAAVGGEVTLGIERLGTPMTLTLPVGDLHAISPSAYLEVGRAVLNDLSYQQARNHDLPVRGAYLASTGYLFGNSDIDEGSLLTHVDGVPTPDLATLQAELERKADGQRILVRYTHVRDARTSREDIVTVDRTWYPMRRCTRSDVDGSWPCADSLPPPPPPPVAPASALLPATGDKLARKIAPSLVLAAFDVPYSTAGIGGQSFLGTGVVVDADKGLVLVDRDTVPVALGDLTLTFAGTVRVPGEVVWLHPLHNLAIVHYDPARLGDVPVRAIELSERWPAKGDKVDVVGLDNDGAVVRDTVEVDDVDALVIPSSGTPRFHDVDVEAIDLARVDRSVGGVVVDKRGRMLGLWSSFYFPSAKERYFYALPSPYAAPVVQALRAGQPPVVRYLGAELRTRSLAEARERGLSDAWIRRYVKADEHAVVLEVAKVMGGSPADGLLRDADLIVARDGAPVPRMRDVEDWRTAEQLSLTVLRDRDEFSLDLPTVALDGEGIRRVVAWAGLLVHAPHLEVALQQGLAPEGAYLAWYWYGSPGARDGLRPTRRIVRIDDTPIATLDDFLAAVATLDPAKPVVLTLEDLDGTVTVRPLELDLDYWPTEIIAWTPEGWKRTEL
ncbi:MAG: trypsin-like peptidase domain-containing protein [Alphaproteobacteria bacterium]|nr:trypsin-like peptidase domain-containing protein [Alphaproteobacteria bacterium]